MAYQNSVPRARAPQELAGLRAERVERAAVRPDEDPAAPPGRGGVHLVVRLEAPDPVAVLRVDRVHAVVPGARRTAGCRAGAARTRPAGSCSATARGRCPRPTRRRSRRRRPGPARTPRGACTTGRRPSCRSSATTRRSGPGSSARRPGRSSRSARRRAPSAGRGTSSRSRPWAGTRACRARRSSTAACRAGACGTARCAGARRRSRRSATGRGFSAFGGGLGSGSSVVTNSSVAEPRFSGGLSWLRTYRPTATAMTIATSPPPTSRRRRVTRRRMAKGHAVEPPDSSVQMRFVTCGSSRLSADSFSCRAHCGVPERITIPPPEAERHERRLARVAARLGHPARRLGEAAGGLEDGEVADEAGHALEQAEAVLEHGQRRRARPDQSSCARRARPRGGAASGRSSPRPSG